MKSFPYLKNKIISDCFETITFLYQHDKTKILEAAQKATENEFKPFVLSNGIPIDHQIETIQSRLSRTADRYGQNLLVKIIEELYESLLLSGAVGVSAQALLSLSELKLNDSSVVTYGTDKKWLWTWELEAEEDVWPVELGIRCKDYSSAEIVRDYILQYVQQAISAYTAKRHAVAMSLMSIALEGTLRDALKIKGYSYSPGAPSEDVYKVVDMHISKLSDGYKVSFPSTMPNSHQDFLSYPDAPPYSEVKIKRIIKYGKTYLEIRKADYLLDYWTSSEVAERGQIKISGLGAALKICRKDANILTSNDLAIDLDDVIKAVRNNLIHLSGEAMGEIIMQDDNGNNIALGDFLNNKNRVFDAIRAICKTIGALYERIANSTL